MIEPLASLIGRHVHYWSSQVTSQHVRHDEVPFTAVVVFVHPNGDLSLRGADHYGATFIDTHVMVKQANEVPDLRHGGVGTEGVCTWPVIAPPQRVELKHGVQVSEGGGVGFAGTAHHHTMSQPSGEPFGMQPLAAEQPREMTEGERRAALELANLRQAAEDAKERRWQTPAA